MSMSIILKSGDSGPAVTALQRALIVTGAKLQGTGNFGVLTGAALSAFQAQHGLQAFGNGDEETMRILAQVSGYPTWAGLAGRELGVKETPGPASTPRVMQYRAIAGCDLDGEDSVVPWCRIFVCAMLALNGLPYQKNWMARSVEVDKNFVHLLRPAYGAIASLWRGSRSSGEGHTGFVLGKTADGLVLIRGGNQNDSVCDEFHYAAGSGSGVVGYYWPASVPTPKDEAPLVDGRGQPVKLT